ncbi:MAG: glycosyltransferase [Bacillota bacterium]|nr:glycosyltransferase [Bacillota bacterium]
MHTIIYLPCFDYFLHRQRPQHLLWELSHLGFRVVYCQPPLPREDRSRRGAGPSRIGRSPGVSSIVDDPGRGRSGGGKGAGDGDADGNGGSKGWAQGGENRDSRRAAVLDVTAGLARSRQPPGPLVPLSDTFILCTDMNALDPSAAHIMWLTHGPYARTMLEWGFRPALVVSDFADACVEEFQEFAAYEHDKLACADIALAASRGLFEDLKERHPCVHLVPNAADFELLSMAYDPSYDLPCPIEVRTILGTGAVPGRKLIGFWGAITTWVDLDLVVRVAVRRPNWHFLFIGYIGVDPSLLPRLSNITFIGDRDHLSLPFFARWFDAAIIPFEVREVTRKACPVKAYEYLAAGLPVVATELPEIEGLADIKIVSQGKNLVADFIGALEWAVGEGKKPEAVRARLDAVRGETWEKRARMVADLIRETIRA